MKIGNREFEINRHTYVMGILNVTPDSFSDGGKYIKTDHALKHAEAMIEEGADLLDIGGESTRPGYRMIPEEEEIARIVPVVEAIKCHFDIPVSLDTYKSKVAAAGIKAGADLINDIWGLTYDKDMAGVIAQNGICCCLMHNRKEGVYIDFMKEVLSDLESSLDLAKKAGIEDDKIILDPGVGFGKSYEQNLEIINKLGQMHTFGYPVLLGTSRKSVIGNTLNLMPEDRLEGTLATTVFGVLKGCSFVRVHDVKANIRAIKMAEAILYSGK